MQTTMSEVKNILHEVSSRWKMQKENISESEGKTTELSKMKHMKKKKNYQGSLIKL